MSNKEQLIEILTQMYKKYDGVYRRNSFDSEPRYQYYNFDEIKSLDNEDIDKIIQVYQSKTTEPIDINNRLLLLECVYETISNNKKYKELFDKLIDIYKMELDDKLTRKMTRYDDFDFVETDELYHAPYTTMPEQSLVLANMCTRYMYESQKSYTEESITLSTKVETRISTYEAIKSDFVKMGKQMPEQQEQIVSQAKEMIASVNEERNINIEREKQQREIELINLQQEITKIENEKLAIEKRIKTISTETLGSYFSKQVSQKYPEEYQQFQQQKNQVKSYSSNTTSIFDLKARYNKAFEDLQFYKNALPAYETFYQKFEEVKKEFEQQKATQNQEQKPPNLHQLDLNEMDINKDKPQQNLSNNLLNLSEDIKEKIIQHMQQMDTKADIKIDGIDKIYQEGNYIVVDAKQSNGQFVGAEFTLEDFSKLFNNPLNKFRPINSSEIAQKQQNDQEKIKETTEQQKEIKDKLVDQIMGAMNMAGEFAFGDISISERMSIMKNVRDKLNSKQIDELQILLSTYQQQEHQDEMKSGMYR